MSDNNKTPINSNGWKQWSANVKESLEKLEKKVDKLEDKITLHREESLVGISTLKAKAGIMGMIAGFVVSTVMSIIIGVLVWQLTVGNTLDSHHHKHEVLEIPEDAISYILPSKENFDYFIIKEDT